MGNSMNDKLVKEFKELGNLYENLGLNQHASDKHIKKAFQKLAIRYHPDKNKAPNAAEIFHRLRVSYEILTDPERKKQFDSYLATQKEHQTRVLEANTQRSTFAKDLLSREQDHMKRKEQTDRDTLFQDIKRKEERAKERKNLEEELKRREEEEQRKFAKAKDWELNSVKIKWKKTGAAYSKDMLRSIFGVYGMVTNVVFIEGKSKGFVQFEKREQAIKAYEDFNSGEAGFDDGLKVKLVKKVSDFEKKSKVYGATAPSGGLDLTVNKSTIERISSFYNYDSNAYVDDYSRELKRQAERDRLIAEALKQHQ
eukprot:TRINITY_DN6582_c0_g1_i1.p1 TRINITY_DN6582_c0_g1~~TRINITY_DN6582_c0_g1_i1.p1  ORF type:complete len:324 (+),score=95.99 TRINITY_DN6582_c0_g1_i1:41-973(+)